VAVWGFLALKSRNSLAFILSKQDIASCDYHQLLHIDGVSYTGVDNPDNTVLSTAGSWTLKYDARQIPIVKMICNTPFSANP